MILDICLFTETKEHNEGELTDLGEMTLRVESVKETRGLHREVA